MKLLLLLLCFGLCSCETGYTNTAKGYSVTVKITPEAADVARDALHGFRK